METSAEIRKRIVDIALSYVGIGASNNREKFKEILGPISGHWDIKRPFSCRKVNGRWVTKGISTCGLVCRGVWREAGVDLPLIYENYNFGRVMIEEQHFCRKLQPHSAWYAAVKNEYIIPLAGDYVIIGNGIMTHNLTCVGYEGNILTSVDGGQVDNKGLQCIKLRERKINRKNGWLYLDNRKIEGWAMVDILPYRQL